MPFCQFLAAVGRRVTEQATILPAGIAAHGLLYTASVKCRELERRLTECGWHFLRHGGNHDVWTDGTREEAVPRHREINERLALTILRRACSEVI